MNPSLSGKGWVTRAALLVGMCASAVVLLAGALSVHGASRSGSRAAQSTFDMGDPSKRGKG